jgi:hypothetical protein
MSSSVSSVSVLLRTGRLALKVDSPPMPRRLSCRFLPLPMVDRNRQPRSRLDVLPQPWWALSPGRWRLAAGLYVLLTPGWSKIVKGAEGFSECSKRSLH